MDYIIKIVEEKYQEYPITNKNVIEKITGMQEIKPYRWETRNNDEEFLYLVGRPKTLQRKEKIFISCDRGEVVIKDFPFEIGIIGDKLFIKKLFRESHIFYNEQQLSIENEIELELKNGDILLADTVKISFYEEAICLLADPECYTSNLLEIAERGLVFEGFPHYKRSPRLIKRIPTESIKISKPPEEKKISKTSLAQMIVTPLIMLAVTVGISIAMKRGLFVVLSAITTIVSIITSITKFVRDKKECKEYNQKREKMYENYLLDIRKQINKARKEEIEALEYNNPEVKNIETMINSYSSRIYERNSSDSDFMTVSIGNIKDKVSFEIKTEYNELAMEKDALEKEAKTIGDSFLYIEKKPVVIDLKKAHLGLVGEKEVIHEQLKLVVAQLTFMQTYHDMQIITIYDSKYNDEFQWMNWYPHLKIKAINVFGSINSEKMRDQVLGSLHQIIKERKMKLDESKKESRFMPHFVFIIDEPKLIMDHSIMEYLDKEGDNLGFSIIYTTHLRANLPENIGTILMLDSSQEGTLLLNNKEMVNQRLNLNRAGDVNFEEMARNISVLIHEQGIVSHIPESITFFDMYKIDSPKQLNIEERWRKNESHKSLAVPLGVRAENDYLYLNLHEKAHGPHGLVAGTTGSGKSEIVQSYILSLAVNFHPYEVGFLLIDYKGGGMAGLFKNLPHLLGTITNLDGSESMRAMASIKSELARRQKKFSENDVNHINAYNKLFKLGKVTEPIPHLFLISDEFAELKKEQPEFMKELVSAARIGRSLGIHLILATQKPSGVVDDQIWTNSKFKLALKVQNEADSKEILKTGDAAFITQPGRAYLQVGNNEIYELFQSAWSGAAYSEEKETEEADDRVYIINDLGQGELINGDLSKGGESNQIKATQLDVVVEEVKGIFEAEEREPVKRPWLPPLSNHMVHCVTQKWTEGSLTENMEQKRIPLSLCWSVGMIDIPEEQIQKEYRLDLVKDGNVAYFAAAGYGKSTFLATAITALAIQNSVDNLNFYIFDFGNSALIPFNKLPHTSDYIVMDDNERMGKFVRIIAEEIKKRKKLLADAMVQNFDVYNQSSDEPLKAIIIVVDNYDVVKEIGYEMEDFFARLSRDGIGLGIYMIITATRGNAVKYVALNNYKNKIAAYMLDASEANALVGKCEYKLPEIEGRAYVKTINTNIMQTYSAVNFKTEIEYNENLKRLLDNIASCYPTKRAPRIPVLPERFFSDKIKEYVKNVSNFIYLGLHKESVELKSITGMTAPFLIVGEGQRGKTNLLKVIIQQLEKQKAFVFDSANKELFYARANANISYIANSDDLEDFIEDFGDICRSRRNCYKEELEKNNLLNPKEFFNSLEPQYVLIDDADEFVEFTKGFEKELSALLKDATETGIQIIATMHSGKQKGFDEISKWFKTSVNGIVIGSLGNLAMYPMISSKDAPTIGEGLLFVNGGYERILIPLYRSE